MADPTADIVRELQAMGISPAAAEQAVHLGARTVPDAVALLFSDEQPRLSQTPSAAPSNSLGAAADGPWDEHFSAEHYGRPFYHNRTAGITVWDEPERHQSERYQLDASVFDLPLANVERVHTHLNQLLSAPIPVLLPGGDASRPGTPATDTLNVCCKTMYKILSNIVVNPSVEKFRTLRKSNATFANKVWCVDGAKKVLLECGFRETAEAVTFPAEASVAALRMAVARLETAEKGAAANRAAAERAGASSSGAGGGAGRYQKEVHHCARCSAFINDGSERVWTRRHDAPRGEYRYQCSTCENYSLCEKCWDEKEAQKWSHTAGHTFQVIHPITSQHNTSVHGVGPWGNFGGGVSARGRERLRERTGL